MIGYSSEYQFVLGWNLIGFVCGQFSSYVGLVYKPNTKFIMYNIPIVDSLSNLVWNCRRISGWCWRNASASILFIVCVIVGIIILNTCMCICRSLYCCWEFIFILCKVLWIDASLCEWLWLCLWWDNNIRCFFYEYNMSIVW